MGAGVASLMDRRKLALTSAKLRAWWDGVDFDEAAALAAIEQVVEAVAPAGAAAAPAPQLAVVDERAVEAELFEAAADPRLHALQLIWGQDRLAPEAGEDQLLAKLTLPEDGALVVLGPGLAGPVRALAAGQRPLQVFEWRSETRAALAAGLEGTNVEGFDLDVSHLPADGFVGMISFDDFTYAGHAPHLALQSARAVKAGCAAVMDCYVGPPGPDLAQAFASAFAEPQLRERSEIEHALSEAGFDIVAEDDLTEAHIAAARAAFAGLSERLTGSAVKLTPGAAQELAWESETWRVRLRMLHRRRLERRRFVLRRRG